MWQGGGAGGGRVHAHMFRKNFSGAQGSRILRFFFLLYKSLHFPRLLQCLYIAFLCWKIKLILKTGVNSLPVLPKGYGESTLWRKESTFHNHLQSPLPYPWRGLIGSQHTPQQEVNLQLKGLIHRDMVRCTFRGFGNNFLLLFFRSQVLSNSGRSLKKLIGP